MINIPPIKADYYNKRVIKLLEHIEEIEETHKVATRSNKPSCIPIHKIGPIIGPFREFSYNENGEIIQVIEHTEKYDYIISREYCKELNNCINDIHRVKDIGTKVSKNFICKEILNWIFSVKIKKQIQKELVQHITDQLNDTVKKYTIYFPMSHLYTLKERKLAMVNFAPIPSEDLNKLLLKDVEKKQFENKVFVSVTVLGEEQFASEMAYRLCSLAVDILKICSKLTFEPNNYGYCLDIDRNIQMPDQYISFTKDSTTQKFLSSNIKVKIHACEIDEEYWAFLVNHDLSIFENFLQKIENNETELKKIIITSIRNFSETLSMGNKYKRVVQLCSILDSIALKDTEAGIKESIKKYIPILVTTKDKRKLVKDNIDKMYNIRSQFIHHAKEIAFSDHDLYTLHLTIFLLIRKMIHETDKHINMMEILQEIDNKLDSIDLF